MPETTSEIAASLDVLPVVAILTGDVATPTFGAASATGLPEADPLEAALSEAAKAGRWDIVGALAEELKARRLAAAGNVIAITDRKRSSS